MCLIVTSFWTLALLWSMLHWIGFFDTNEIVHDQPIQLKYFENLLGGVDLDTPVTLLDYFERRLSVKTWLNENVFAFFFVFKLYANK